MRTRAAPPLRRPGAAASGRAPHSYTFDARRTANSRPVPAPGAFRDAHAPTLFLDRDGARFAHVLNYLRSGTVHLPPTREACARSRRAQPPPQLPNRRRASPTPRRPRRLGAPGGGGLLSAARAHRAAGGGAAAHPAAAAGAAAKGARALAVAGSRERRWCGATSHHRRWAPLRSPPQTPNLELLAAGVAGKGGLAALAPGARGPFARSPAPGCRSAPAAKRGRCVQVAGEVRCSYMGDNRSRRNRRSSR